MPATDQCSWDIRFEWGASGLNALRGCRTFVIVDVLSFSTSVSVAVDRGATVFPFEYDAAAAHEFAEREDAILAGARSRPGYSLSPNSLLSIEPGTRLVLPSPNGSTLCRVAATMGIVLAGCLRNGSAVARRAQDLGRPIAVVAAGERWLDGSLRPCLEDFWGAGAVIAQLDGSRSPEATAAVNAYFAVRDSIEGQMGECSSGRELIELGYFADVQLAAALDVSLSAPELRDGRFCKLANVNR
jgi:2-phosphosulfolactate phosphatase